MNYEKRIFKRIKSIKDRRKLAYLLKEDLRNNMELILTDSFQEATKRLSFKEKPRGLVENIKVAKKCGRVAKVV